MRLILRMSMGQHTAAQAAGSMFMPRELECAFSAFGKKESSALDRPAGSIGAALAEEKAAKPPAARSVLLQVRRVAMTSRERVIEEMRAGFRSEPDFGPHGAGYVLGVNGVGNRIEVVPIEATGAR